MKSQRPYCHSANTLDSIQPTAMYYGHTQVDHGKPLNESQNLLKRSNRLTTLEARWKMENKVMSEHTLTCERTTKPSSVNVISYLLLRKQHEMAERKYLSEIGRNLAYHQMEAYP